MTEPDAFIHALFAALIVGVIFGLVLVGIALAILWTAPELGEYARAVWDRFQAGWNQ